MATKVAARAYLPGADERGLDGRAEEVEVLNKLAKRYGIERNLIVKIDNTSPTLSSAHHEKIIVVDNKIGFCGGFDLSRGKWDTRKHYYNDPHRDQDSEPWHDLHAMIKGPDCVGFGLSFQSAMGVPRSQR